MIVPAALVLLAGRRLAPIVAGAATAIGFHLLLWLPWGIGNVWEQSYEYHLEVASDRTPGANLAKVLSTMGDRDAIVLVAAALALGAVVLRRRRGRPARRAAARRPRTSCCSRGWAPRSSCSSAEHPMWRPHVSQLVPGLALLAARHRPSWRVLAVAGDRAAPLLRRARLAGPAPGPLRGQRRRGRRPAARRSPTARWRSATSLVSCGAPGRRTPPDLVDASVLRIETGDITSESLAEAAAEPDVCAVVVRSGERWGRFDDLPDRLADAGYEVAAEDGDVRRVYLKPDCRTRRSEACRSVGTFGPGSMRIYGGGGRGGRGGGGRGWRR